METDKINAKQKLITKYLKKNNEINIFTILLNNIDGANIYIALCWHKKNKTFRVFWFDINHMETDKVSDWVNSNLIFVERVNEFKRIIAEHGMSEEYIDKDDINDSQIIMQSFITNYEFNRQLFTFKRYIPKCWQFLADAIYILFDNMPRVYYLFFQIMIEKIIIPSENNIFAWDLKKNDITKLFNPEVQKIGNQIYENNQINKMESIKDTTYALVTGKQNNLVTILNNPQTKEVAFTCTCHKHTFCEHIYAAYLAYQNKYISKYYKISYKDENKSLLERLKSFSYFLCLDIDNNDFIVIKNSKIVRVPILDNKGKCNWEILEDNNQYLENRLKEYLKGHESTND
jgi:hypothetical protein